MHRSRRIVDIPDFPCSDGCKRTVGEERCSCAEDMSFVIVDRKAHTIDTLYYLDIFRTSRQAIGKCKAM